MCPDEAGALLSAVLSRRVPCSWHRLVVAVADSEANLRRWPLGRMAMGLLVGVGMTLVSRALAADRPALVTEGAVPGPSPSSSAPARCSRPSVPIGPGRARRRSGWRGRGPRPSESSGPGCSRRSSPIRMSPGSRGRWRSLRDVKGQADAGDVSGTQRGLRPGCALPVMRDRRWRLDLLGVDRRSSCHSAPKERAILEADSTIVLSSLGYVSGFNLNKTVARRWRWS